jgi:hypothetical protein
LRSQPACVGRSGWRDKEGLDMSGVSKEVGVGMRSIDVHL